MPLSLVAEIERNYAVFQSHLPALLADKRGQYALLHKQEVRGTFVTAGDAHRAGYTSFGDEPYSVQLVTDEPVDLGFFSFAPSDR